MSLSGLRCKCGHSGNFSLQWNELDKWKMTLNCCDCGMVYELAESTDKNARVIDVVGDNFCNARF